jgi:acetyl esterase/lipase
MMSLANETYVYKTVCGCEIGADVYRASKRPDPAPVIVWIHGGCLMYGSRKAIHPDHLTKYVGAGFTVVSIDYRLAPETLLPSIIEDLQDAFQWVRVEGPGLYGIDPRRIAVVGHSAGGYLSLMAGACVTPRPRAVVAFYGYGDIVGDWYSKPDPFYCRQPAISREEAYEDIGHSPIASAQGARAESPIYYYCRQNGLWPNVVGGHDPTENPEAFVPYCPIQNIGADYPPTLLLHGDQDTDVPYEQSVMMSEALSKRGIENELITMRGRGHGFDGDATVLEVTLDAVLAFLQAHLVAAEPRGQEEARDRPRPA